MIVSYHPLFEGHVNGLAAGRDPGCQDEEKLRNAEAVVLPQGCTRSWYRLATSCCPHVFPNYDARFAYPGKAGQVTLFRNHGAAHPHTLVFPNLNALMAARGDLDHIAPLPIPFVFKFAWGDEGRTVHLVDSEEAWAGLLDTAKRFEATGQKGCLLQAMVPSANRSMRVAVIGGRRIAYWRVGGGFKAGVARGAQIDTDSDPALMDRARDAVDRFCRRTGINLAGVDLLFSTDPDVADAQTPLFIEINYYFGRTGLGGSEAYYRILMEEIKNWIRQLPSGRLSMEETG
ncbi:MAG: hypothetical protein PVH30_01385 [Desulfobacterales bacterium]|jgi:ribosomal protein S6--L-glutamate ligase